MDGPRDDRYHDDDDGGGATTSHSSSSTSEEEPATGILFPRRLDGMDLAGCGVRVKFGFVKVYAVGTYLDVSAMSRLHRNRTMSDADIKRALLDPSYHRIIRIVLYRSLPTDKVMSAIVEGLRPRMRGEGLESLLHFEELLNPKGGDVEDIVLVEGSEIILTVRGDALRYKNALGGTGEMRSASLTRAMCDVYYGDDAVSPSHAMSAVGGARELLASVATATDTTTTATTERRRRLRSCPLPPRDDSEGIGRPGGAIVVFAKCPTPGSSKTRLEPLLGREGAATLAEAMLSDVLVSITECPRLRDTLKVLAFAPGTAEGERRMVSILQSLRLAYHRDVQTAQAECGAGGEANGGGDRIIDRTDGWVLLPMKASDLSSSSLGDKLEDALDRTRALLGTLKGESDGSSRANDAVLFLGMDSPELPIDEIVHGLTQSGCINSSDAHRVGKAHMCPASDGGYGLLSVPGRAPSSRIFSGVRWSTSLTAVSQLKALTDCGVDVSLGKLMHDVDELVDVMHLVRRLERSREGEDDTRRPSGEVQASDDRDSLANPSSGIGDSGMTVGDCYFPRRTWDALVELKMPEECAARFG